MCTTGLKQTSHMKPKIFPGTLCVPLICAMIIIIYVVFQNDMNTKLKIIYPKKKPFFLKASLKVCDVPVQSGPVIKVGDHKTYVIGSYVEHRSDVKKIKTVAIVLRNEVVDYYCLICCNGKNISVPALYTIHSDHFNFEYGAADIVCDVPKSCTTQLYVAVTAKSNKDSGSLQNIQSFQMVENQKPPKSYPYNFTVCISVMYDYDNVLQLVQAMEMFKILGVQRVAVYKTNCSSTAQKILDYYVKSDFVEIIPWIVPSYIRVSRGWQKSASPGELHYFGQIAALNDCVYRYMYRSNYVALHDLDELILPMKLMNWTALLDHLEKKYGYNMGFEFENVLFAASLKQQKPEYSPDLWKKISGVNILEHVIGLKNDPTKFNNIKVIVNPRLVFKATVHGLLEILGGTVRVSPEVAHMYHVKHVPEELLSKDLLVNDTHLWDYAERLVPVVSEVLEQALNIH